MAVQIKPKITEQDLLALGDVRAEVIDGRIEVDVTVYTLHDSQCMSRISVFLGSSIRMRDVGWIGGSKTPFILQAGPNGGIVEALSPHVYFISYERLPADSDIEIVPTFAPDLAVEIISESETHTRVLKKVGKYLDYGTAQVWHVIPSLREVHIFTPSNRSGAILGNGDTLTGGDLLPGFAIPVRALFDLSDSALHAETLRALMP